MSCTATPIHRVGNSNRAVLNTVQLRPPKIGTTKEYSARKSAPDRPGSAASQNNWFGVNWKPTLGSLTTITLHTTQTAKASSRAGMDSHRLRLAMRRPVCCQKLSSSGRQSISKCRRRRDPARPVRRPPVRRERRRGGPECLRARSSRPPRSRSWWPPPAGTSA